MEITSRPQSAKFDGADDKKQTAEKYNSPDLIGADDIAPSTAKCKKNGQMAGERKANDENTNEVEPGIGFSMLNGDGTLGRQVATLFDRSSQLLHDDVTLSSTPSSDRHTDQFADSIKEGDHFFSNQPLQSNDQHAATLLDPSERLRHAVMPDGLGTRLKIWSKKNCAWFKGTVIGYNEKKSKHRIQFDVGNQVKSFCLENETWRYIDMLGKVVNPDSPEMMSTSQLLCVERCSKMSWGAYKTPLCLGNSFGAFASEKDTAVVSDFFARNKGLPVNLDKKQIQEFEADNRNQMTEEDKAIDDAKQHSKSDIAAADLNNKRAGMNHLDDSVLTCGIENRTAVLGESQKESLAPACEIKCTAANKSDDVAITQVTEPLSSSLHLRYPVGSSFEKVCKI